jgi:nucleotide-binding universal stress UspA family protein
VVKQYQHILVPLDSSELAELALDDALSIASLSGAEVTLLHVATPIEKVIAADTDHPVFVDQQWDERKMLARDYLDKICSRLDCKNVTVHTEVAMGMPAETIIEYTHDHPIDLIVMATHGRSGLQRWVYGSVADKVLRGANVPTLLVRARTGNGAVE